MYVPAHFKEQNVAAMHALMRAQPLATLIVLSSDGLNANHIPLHLSEQPSPFGTLRGHVARANPVWNDHAGEVDALAVFHGPDAYITPSWYATKKDTGKVVPTWNYAVVHASGRLRIIEDAAWLRAQLEALTAHNEAAFQAPWSVADAPRDFTDKLIGAIVGIEIVITKLYGKSKLSQNQPPQNQAGVIEGLHASGERDAAAMAGLIAAATTGKKKTERD